LQTSRLFTEKITKTPLPSRNFKTELKGLSRQDLIGSSADRLRCKVQLSASGDYLCGAIAFPGSGDDSKSLNSILAVPRRYIHAEGQVSFFRHRTRPGLFAVSPVSTNLVSLEPND